jgi:phosphotransferase system HPr (HPr) family protein
MANILVVDDYRDSVESMATWLEHYGHDVQIARDGYQAIEIARRQRPNYVLLDLGMPGLDGYQVATKLRKEMEGPLVIIAITGYGQEADRQRAFAAGCDHHLLKPIDHSVLVSLLPRSQTWPEAPVRDGPQSEAAAHEGCTRFMLNRDVEVTNTLGLHLRAASKFVALAQQFQADVSVIYDGRKANGKSILDLATLAAACGSQLELKADGHDGESALDALVGLVGRGFDEQE